jgi:hypothetical protein
MNKSCFVRCKSLFTVLASSAGDVEGHHDAIAFLQQTDAVAGFFYDSHIFMTEYQALLGRGSPFLASQLIQCRVLAYMCKSEPQIAVVVILTMTSSGCSILGFSTSWTLSLNGSWYTTAFIDMLTFAVVRPERSRENAWWNLRGRYFDRHACRVCAGNCQETLPAVIASY